MPTNILYMPAVAMDMTVWTNADWLDGLEYWDQRTPPQPIDMGGIEFEMEMRTAPPAVTVVLKASTDNGLIVVYANTWQFKIPAMTMNLVPAATYVYDMLAVADGYVRIIASGGVTVNQGITRPPEILGVPQISMGPPVGTPPPSGLPVPVGEPLGYLPKLTKVIGHDDQHRPSHQR
jgi:hypothetical protein